jgi:hypothetical protein
MREPLVLRLEQLSYYQHLSLTGGQERPIFSYRIVDIRGSRFHVLSRIQDAGLDFTGRTNFVAHHLALAAEEFRQFPTPPIILRDWPGWAKSWTREPALFEKEDWSALISLAGKSSVPAQTWQRVTGDAVNGFGLLEARAGATFRVDDQTSETVLGLFAESVELLEVRDARRDYRAAALQYTFTTSMQEQDNPADFRWRCIHSDNPAANRFATPDCRALSAVRATKWTAEETAFAGTGRQAPRFVAEPQDVRITEGDTAHFLSKAEGIPSPAYQWFSVDRSDNGQPLAGETNPGLALANPTLGKSRYVVRVVNSAGDAMSRVATLSVEHKPRLVQRSLGVQTRPFGSAHQKSESEVEKERKWLESEPTEKLVPRSQRRKRLLTFCSLAFVVVLAIAGVIVMNPALRSNFNNHLSTILPFFPSSTNANLTKQDTPHAQANALTPQVPSKNLEDSSAKTEQRSDVLANPMSSPPPTLPDGWTIKRIGVFPGDASCKHLPGDQFELRVAAEGLGSNKDTFFFVYRTDTTKQLKVTLGTNLLSEQASAGIMVRNSEEVDAPFLFIGMSSTNIVTIARTNGISWTNRSASCSQGNPVTLTLSSKGIDFTAEYSSDQSGAILAHFSSKENPLVGLAAWSGNPTNPATVLFTKVSIPDAGKSQK